MKHNRAGKIISVIIILFCLIVAAGCSMEPEKVTKENYDKLSMFMPFESVVEILGEPNVESTRLGVRQYTWFEGERHIHAKFMADRAVYYSSKGLEATESSKGH